MIVINEFISQYGATIIYTILTAIVGALGTWIGRVYKKYINDKTKNDVAKTVVQAVEQIYKDLHGEDKYNKAVDAIVEMLGEKNIAITELEIKMLIESCCNEFTKTISA